MTVPTLMLLALTASGASASTQMRAEGESFSGARVVKDRGAHGGRALLLVRATTVRRRLTVPAGAEMVVRARGRACRGRLTARAGGRGATARLRDGGWRRVRLRPEMPGGRQRVELRFAGLRRGCRAALRIDTVVFAGAARSTPAPPPPAPQPAPQPQPQPTPPPAEPADEPEPLPPSPLSPLFPDAQRSGAVPLGAALFWTRATADLGYRAAFLEHFDALTPENEMKWERLQPRQGLFAFAEADALVAFAQEHQKPIHGHTLIWHGQTPGWVYAGWTRDELVAIMRDHIHTVVGRFKGKVAEWDVVNEPFNDDGSYRDNVWHQTIGPTYIEMALRFAREADPDAKLFVNEIGADVSNPKSDALFHLAETYRLLGVPLDGIGFQNHTNHNGYPRRAALQSNLERFASLGLQVQFTEMDVAAKGDAASLEQRLTAQAAAFRDAALACHSVPACTRFTVWGVTDRYSWVGADEIPLLLDADLQVKPAMTAVRGVIGG